MFVIKVKEFAAKEKLEIVKKRTGGRAEFLPQPLLPPVPLSGPRKFRSYSFIRPEPRRTVGVFGDSVYNTTVLINSIYFYGQKSYRTYQKNQIQAFSENKEATGN